MPILPHRRLGSIEVSAVSLGCMGLNHAYQPQPSEEQAARLLNHALDAGVTMLDTAALYGDGANESLLAKAVGHRRSEFTLASKCVLGLFDGKRGLDGRPEAITRTLEGALARLKTDHIDLYYLHRLDRKVPIEESVGALVRAVEAGKISAIGLSEMSAATIRRAHGVHPITAIQTEYSPCVRNAEVAVFDACAELGIGFVAFSPVCRGLLAGAIRAADYPAGDLRHSLPRFVEPNLARNLELVARFDALAHETGITPAQLALGWVLAKHPFIVALPGTTSLAHLDENVAAARVTLSDVTVAAVDSIFAPGAMAGPRYLPAVQAQVDTELLPDEIA
jgi:aryl-alcohol dehydrogenase-like predicted oxidoreductase